MERIGDLLSSLDKVDVTLPILRESKVGATVSKLKKHANDGVSGSAKALVKKWKKVAEASGAQQGEAGNAAAAAAATPGKSEKPSSSGKGTVDRLKIAATRSMPALSTTAAVCVFPPEQGRSFVMHAGLRCLRVEW